MMAAMDSSGIQLITTNSLTTTTTPATTTAVATPIRQQATITNKNNSNHSSNSSNNNNNHHHHHPQQQQPHNILLDNNHSDNQQQQRQRSATTSNSKLMGHIEDRLYRYRAKRIRFLINGDKYFAGINYALNTERIRSFDALLNDLTRSLSMDHLKLCKGVRYLFSIDGTMVQALTDFQDGQTYICSSTDVFISTEYRLNTGMLNWLVRNSACISSSDKAARTTNNHNRQMTATNTSTSTTPSATRQRNNIEPSHNSGATNQGSRSVNKIPKINNHSTPSRTINQQRQQQQQKLNAQQQQQHLQQSSSELAGLFGTEVIDKYDIGQPIGDGHFSVVYCCMNKSTQDFCALKLIDKLKCRGRDDMIYNEVKILKRLDHPNIVKLIEEFDYPKQLYLILELVQDGDLFDAISNVTKFSEIDVATMIHNLSSALAYLHARGIVHRDIKPENLLISVQEDGSQSVKLADFGLAVEVSDSPLYSVCGTAFYVSPEMLNESGYSYKVDVWSTGVICFILLCGYPPFTSENENNQDELFDAILAGEFEFADPQWSRISQHAKNLIKCMLIVDPEKRYTAEQVFKHPWTMGMSNNFDGINPMNMSRKIACQSHEQDM